VFSTIIRIIRYGVRVLVRINHLNNISANGTFTVLVLIVRLLGACYLAVHVLSCVLTYVPMSVCIDFPIAAEIVLPCRYYKPAAFGTGDRGCAIAVIGVCNML